MKLCLISVIESMMLSKNEILKEIRKGNLKVTPFDKKNVGPCSIDLRLGNNFRRFKSKKKMFLVNENVNENNFSQKFNLKNNEFLIIKSGELVLGTTLEKIKLNNSICGKLDGRSRFARIGLMVHVSSSLVQPGVNNVQVLEIINLSPFTLSIQPGLKICQITFHKLSSPANYNGKFKRQTQP